MGEPSQSDEEGSCILAHIPHIVLSANNTHVLKLISVEGSTPLLMNALELLVQADISCINEDENLRRLRQATLDEEAEIDAAVEAEVEAEI